MVKSLVSILFVYNLTVNFVVLDQLLDNILLDIEHQFLLYQYFHTNKFDLIDEFNMDLQNK